VEKGRDRNNRRICEVYYGSVWINQEMVAAGMAWQYIRFDSSVALRKIQEKAKQEKKGLWQMPNAIEPWLFRHPKSKQ
jgi:micrococcal nuclease